jgi:hypothetical protein
MRLVGRTQEMNNLALALEECFSGEGCLYSVTGGPGIGKTRLANEFASRARDRGAKVVWGRCSTFEVPPNWPWIQIVRGCESNDTATEAREICQLLENEPSHTRPERFKLFDRIRSLFIEFTHSRPLVVIIDDLHAADESSLLLLAFFARELADAKILMLLVFREAEVYFSLPTGCLFRDLALRITRRISLGELNRYAVAELIAETIGQSPDGSLVEAIYEKTGGNPLFTEIALRYGLVDWQKRRIRRIPEVLRPAVERYLSAVSSAARELLSLGSLIGAEFEFAVIRAASGVEAEQLLNLLAESEFAGVLQRVDTPSGRYRFVHGFIREALSDAITGAKRARLHGRIAETLEALYERGVDVDLADIAHHFVEGAVVGHAAKALEYCQRAAEHASQRQTFQESSRVFQMVQSALALHSSFGEPTYKRDRELVDRPRASDETAIATRNQDPRPRVSALAGRNPQAEELSDFKTIEGLSQNGENLRGHTAIGHSEERKTFGMEAQLDSQRIQPSRAHVMENDEPEGATLPDVRNGYSETHSLKNPAIVIPSEKIFRREGEYWTIAYEGKVIRLRHSKGLAYIAHLMAHAGREFHVTDLSTLGQRSIVPDMPAIGAETHGLAQEFGDAGPELDPSAKSSYRQRLQELRDELREAKSFYDLGRIANIETEIEFISRELARAIGLGGRDRRASSDTERARLRVTMAVKSTVKKIAEQHPRLGRRLMHSVRTGNFCSFEPESPSLGPWQM